MNTVLYIHGKGGSVAECEHYKPLFPESEVIDLDYQTFTPWETGDEIHSAVAKLKSQYEQELKSKGVVHTEFGEDLPWDYLCYVRNHPIEWCVPTQILYGSQDHLMTIETITDFANKHHATLTIMEGGEHWFHTTEQMQFLDNWIINKQKCRKAVNNLN